MLDRVALLLFVLGFAFLSYLYGVASSRFSLFPYEIVREAWIAGKALREAIAAESVDMPPGALAFETGSASSQSAQTMADARPSDKGLILVTGGPYELMAKCPELGCLAWIMDRSGTVYHTWPIHRDAPWGDVKRHVGFSNPDNIYPSGLHLYDNGDLSRFLSGLEHFSLQCRPCQVDKNGRPMAQKACSHHSVLCRSGWTDLYTFSSDNR